MKTTFLRSSLILGGFLCMTTLGACDGMNSTQQRTLSGAAIGTGVGAAAGAVTGGCVTCGAAIGAGVGAVGGYAYDKSKQ